MLISSGNNKAMSQISSFRPFDDKNEIISKLIHLLCNLKLDIAQFLNYMNVFGSNFCVDLVFSIDIHCVFIMKLYFLLNVCKTFLVLLN